jgi:APA family basic amino acid/polyamine antiporter
LLVFRRREPARASIGVPFHPVSTLLFVGACWAIAIATVVTKPRDAGGGVAILLIGVPVYLLWSRRRASLLR